MFRFLPVDVRQTSHTTPNTINNGSNSAGLYHAMSYTNKRYNTLPSFSHRSPQTTFQKRKWRQNSITKINMEIKIHTNPIA